MGTFDTNRSLLKYILLGIITFGIYDVWVLARAGEDLNVIASRWDGRRTMNFWLVALVISPLTIELPCTSGCIRSVGVLGANRIDEA